jgi:hypothetical protein
MWRDAEMWHMLQNYAEAARHMKNHAIVAACGGQCVLTIRFVYMLCCGV